MFNNDDSSNEKKSGKFGFKISELYEKLQENIPALLITCVSAFIVMILACIAIFSANIKGPEKVLVPNVVGEKLEDALLELQIKELYPRITLRYSNSRGDEGKILEQSPSVGAIVRGYSRVSLVVSRGVIVDKIDDYVGSNIEDLRMKLQTLFAGQTKALIVLDEPKYIPNAQPAGTILEQEPPAGTKISEPVTVQLVVSRGPNYENTRPPVVKGQSINDLLQTIARSKLVFEISSHIAKSGEKAGTVTAQEEFEEEFIPNYTRVKIDMAMPKSMVQDNIYGIFSEKLASYPFPVNMRLEAIPTEGSSYTIISFAHPGGLLTIPYAVPSGTTLVLYVADKQVSKKTIN